MQTPASLLRPRCGVRACASKSISLSPCLSLHGGLPRPVTLPRRSVLQDLPGQSVGQSTRPSLHGQTAVVLYTSSQCAASRTVSPCSFTFSGLALCFRCPLSRPARKLVGPSLLPSECHGRQAERLLAHARDGLRPDASTLVGQPSAYSQLGLTRQPASRPSQLVAKCRQSPAQLRLLSRRRTQLFYRKSCGRTQIL